MLDIGNLLAGRLQENMYRVGAEGAWTRNDAIDVISKMKSLDIAIVGVEIWLRTEPGPTIPAPFIYTWTMEDRKRNVNWRSYVSLSCDKALDYVSSFTWDTADIVNYDKEPYFDLTPLASD